jgi:hypothetical protein
VGKGKKPSIKRNAVAAVVVVVVHVDEVRLHL